MQLYNVEYMEPEMFIIDALISSVNDFICITEHLIYHPEYRGTSGCSSVLCSFLLVGSLGSKRPPVLRRQSERCGSVSKAKYSRRYMMRHRGRQLHTASGRWKMDCGGVNNNGRVRASQSPTRLERYHRRLGGELLYSPGEHKDLYTDCCSPDFCVCVFVDAWRGHQKTSSENR